MHLQAQSDGLLEPCWDPAAAAAAQFCRGSCPSAPHHQLLVPVVVLPISNLAEPQHSVSSGQAAPESWLPWAVWQSCTPGWGPWAQG